MIPVITIKVTLLFILVVAVGNTGCASKQSKPEILPPINVNHRYA